MPRSEVREGLTALARARLLENDLDRIEGDIKRRLDILDARSRWMLITFVALLIAVIGNLIVLLITRTGA